MNDREIRALQVKMLTEPQLRALHGLEVEQAATCPASTIAEKFRLPAIKDHYRVTKRTFGARRTPPRDLHRWAEQVRRMIDAWLTAMRATFGERGLESLHGFDWAIWKSDLDFHFRPAPAAPKARRTDDWASRAERP